MIMNNYSYVTLLSNNDFIYGVLLLYKGLKETKSQFPLTCIVTNNVSQDIINKLRKYNINIIIYPEFKVPKEYYEHNFKIDILCAENWKNVFSKLYIFDLEQFDKIIYLDADIMILKNLDHLFTYPHMSAAIVGDYFNKWPDWVHFNSGCMVIEPSKQLYKNILQFYNHLTPLDFPDYMFITDQEILNKYYDNWPNQIELHLNKYYNIFPSLITNIKQLYDIKDNGYFVHFVGAKPWQNWKLNLNKDCIPYFYLLANQKLKEDII